MVSCLFNRSSLENRKMALLPKKQVLTLLLRRCAETGMAAE